MKLIFFKTKLNSPHNYHFDVLAQKDVEWRFILSFFYFIF